VCDDVVGGEFFTAEGGVSDFAADVCFASVGVIGF
jgi:hypothetical protein